ncbi:phosphatidylglycerophosphatase A family protein [Deferrisoma palaeochoriense]
MDPWTLAASGLGVGRLPRAPGTWGTLAAVPLVAALGLLPWPLELGLFLLCLPLAAAACGRAARAEAEHDPPWIVLDEALGFWVAVLGLPPGIGAFVAGVVAFRAFDILKPPPIRWIDRRVGGGWGILLDDLAAGLAARGVLELLVRSGWL